MLYGVGQTLTRILIYTFSLTFFASSCIFSPFIFINLNIKQSCILTRDLYYCKKHQLLKRYWIELNDRPSLFLSKSPYCFSHSQWAVSIPRYSGLPDITWVSMPCTLCLPWARTPQNFLVKMPKNLIFGYEAEGSCHLSSYKAKKTTITREYSNFYIELVL